MKEERLMDKRKVEKKRKRLNEGEGSRLKRERMNKRKKIDGARR